MDKIGIPVFQTKEKTKKHNYNYSLVIAPVTIAKLLYDNLLPSDTKYQLEIKYKIEQMGIEVEELPIFQSSPFIDTKKPHICTRIFRTCYSRLNWYFVTPLKELANKPDRQLLPDKLKESSIYRFAFAALAITALAPVPVPPPIPAVMKTMSEPSMNSFIFSYDSSAACLPMSGFPPLPRPFVRFSPI